MAQEGVLPMQNADYCRIPLYRRDGSIRAWAFVDPADREALSKFRWRLNDVSSNPGKVGYAVRTIRLDDGRKRYQGMHRQILGLGFGDERQVDHLNRETLDDRRANLRVVTHAENMRNRPAHRGSTSRYRGVHWDNDRSKWRAEIKVNGQKIRLGRFADEEAAGRAAHAYLTFIGWPVDPFRSLADLGV
jgi:hypothetical protein